VDDINVRNTIDITAATAEFQFKDHAFCKS